MHDIETEYIRVRQILDQIGGAAFFSREHKKSREWYVLGAVRQLLLHAGRDFPTLAEESEAPDFRAYHADGCVWAPIEIVEVLPPDYKRHAHYKEVEQGRRSAYYVVGPPLQSPWEPLRKQITEKAHKRYPKGTCLIVYHDIGRLSFSDPSTPFHERLLAEHAVSPFIGLGSFARVLILSSEMECLVQLHPITETLVSDKGH
ncbi:MAG: hypothetical protein ABJF10_06575 [Chthoniobacter sp.]|uniref:hypothetical protein n=1 Tax=Chthoniobacter sp. TaxID=2510640 RepID=UPI0032A4E9B3